LPYRNREISFLEIGVQNGGSLQIWNKYFNNAKNIIGCDINTQCGQLVFDNDRVKLVLGDITESVTRQTIATYADKYDIVIDDGSHKSADIIKAFKCLYPLLAPGGLYVIEDLHCSYWAKWGGGLWRSDSAMEFFKNLIDVLNLESWGTKTPCNKIISRYKSKLSNKFNPNDYKDIESICFYNSMCLIIKGLDVNSIGGRLVVGEIALIQERMPLNDSLINVPFQSKIVKKLRI
jgi:SAM-dependent methyltransferase